VEYGKRKMVGRKPKGTWGEEHYWRTTRRNMAGGKETKNMIGPKPRGIWWNMAGGNEERG
jgi:hypothetical protein